MILDRLEQLNRYTALHPLFGKAFEFLHQAGLKALSIGRHEIDGDRLFAIVGHDQARSREKSKLEAHRKYIDIQAVLLGTDEMGWKNVHQCRKSDGGYSDEKDVEFFLDSPDAWVPVTPGCFAIFFPEDAHAPLVGMGELIKVVVKVAI